MARGRRGVGVVLSEGEREVLERWARRHKSSQALALRCRVVLGAAAGETNKAVAARLGCAGATVSKWRRRFAVRRLEGLADEARPGPPRKAGDEMVEEVVVRTLESAPAGATHWSTRSMAAAVGLSQSTVSRIWRAFALKPHIVEEFKVSPDPQFIDKVRDVAGLYLNPPQAAVVLCVDEKTQIQAIDRTAAVLALMPGAAQRRSHDYRRFGAADPCAALDAASGRVLTQMGARHRSEEFRKFLNLIDKEVPDRLDVHVVLDNASTHKSPMIQRRLARRPRFSFCFTPTYSSWMNLVERWFAEPATKWIRRGTHRSTKELTESIQSWTDHRNQNPRPFVWRKTADETLDNLAAYIQRIPDSGH